MCAITFLLYLCIYQYDLYLFFFFLKGIVDDFNKAQGRIEQLPEGEMETFSDYQTKTFTTCKLIVKNIQEITSNANNRPTEIIASSRQLSGSYNRLVDSVQGALATIESDEVTAILNLHYHQSRLMVGLNGLFSCFIYRLVIASIQLSMTLGRPVFS